MAHACSPTHSTGSGKATPSPSSTKRASKSCSFLLAGIPSLRHPLNGDDDSALAGIPSRLHFLDAVGLNYLTLDRSSRTLSGGETMRVNLTSCLGSALTDTVFVLDEPSVGLHPRDMDRLIAILRRLTDLGNTVVVVEHDEAVMRAADNLIEVGPEPGIRGGQIVFHGSYQRILKSDTQTGNFLSGIDNIETPLARRNIEEAARLSVTERASTTSTRSTFIFPNNALSA